jgi:hypothetical protein
MAPINPNEARAAFMRTFKDTAPYKHRYEVWRDFVTMSACALHNGLFQEDTREAEYLRIIEGYKPDDQMRFPKLMGLLITILDIEPRDILGPLYMELEIANKDAGQFFTPPELSELMARINFGETLSILDNQPFITLAEPACGAGGMVLACVKVLIEEGRDPSRCLWVQCIDVDRVAALMCYVQLTLWNVPAQVIVGNTLSGEQREIWYTPAHHLGFWGAKLRSREPEATPQETPKADVQIKRDDNGDPVQLSLF